MIRHDELAVFKRSFDPHETSIKHIYKIGQVYITIPHCTWATIDAASPALAGNITVLLVFAKLPKAWTYCSATVSDAALSPLWKEIKVKNGIENNTYVFFFAASIWPQNQVLASETEHIVCMWFKASFIGSIINMRVGG